MRPSVRTSPARGTVPPRERRASGCFAVLAGLLLTGVLAVFAVVWVADRWSSPTPKPSEATCYATVDETRWRLTPTQSDNAAFIVAHSVQRQLPARAATIAIATAIQESSLRNIDYGDRDSLGLFQQRPSQGWGSAEQIMDRAYSTGAFYDALVKVKGYEQMEITVAAQRVQRSGFPDAYAQHDGRARAWASALTGHSPSALTCDLPATSTDPWTEQAFRTRIQADLGPMPFRATGFPASVIVQYSAPDISPTRAEWIIAHWTVATAYSSGVTQVRTSEGVWLRSGDGWQLGAEAIKNSDPAVELSPGEVAVFW